MPQYLPADVSIIIVSDFEAGEKTWNDEILSIAAFLADTEARPGEIVVMEAEPPTGERPAVPAQIAQLAPLVQVHFAPFERSSQLKDAGLPYTTLPLVAVIEADCLPEAGWLSALVAAMNADPVLEIVSGRTTYGPGGSLYRVATLLDRGLMEERDARGCARHVSVNGALYRRPLLERYPFPDEVNPFIAAELRLQRMHADDVVMGIAPDATIRHAFHGLPFMIDLRRNKGFQGARIELARPAGFQRSTFQLAWHGMSRSMGDDWRTIAKLGAKRLRWWDWPLLTALFLLVRIPEFNGGLQVRDPQGFAAISDYR